MPNLSLTKNKYKEITPCKQIFKYNKNVSTIKVF